ncbi:class I SAM-dependent methyltransferase [Streptomyces sp. NPDC051561]|uniref:class I SAM-dependent methyltransferase n=1 Tax=Streptomyces sp. NPDC051561 TaxID=3365658 RepID=UPI0037A3EA72
MTASSSHLVVTADAYDAIAVTYAGLDRTDLVSPSLDHSMIAAFADFVRDTPAPAAPATCTSTSSLAPAPALVAELGCGPGPVTAHLRDLGIDVYGVDLSPVMIDLAREAYPDLRFEVGDMCALELADSTLTGVVSWYSVIHTPPEELPAYFAEFRRVLAPGGHLLLAFFESDGDPVTPFDHKVTTAYRWPIDALARMAIDAGLTEVGRMLREPTEGERFRRGHLLMRAAE